FTLYLPQVAPADPEQDEQAHSRMLKAGARVLVVEDNAEVGEFATQALAELGYGSHWAPDGAQALQELENNASCYDVVFTDVVMPGGSGIDLAEEVRRRYPGLPVVLTSGYSHILAQRGSSGFTLLHKPYSIEELAKALRAVTVED
ncbi:MAG: response regulator, partial [Alphaproteobacteria bacterium]